MLCSPAAPAHASSPPTFIPNATPSPPSYGLKDPIHAGSENVVERVLAETDGRGADAVILAVGGNALIKTAMDAARCGGKVMLFAQTQRGDATFDPGVVCMDEKTLMGSYSSSFDDSRRSHRPGIRRLPQRI